MRGVASGCERARNVGRRAFEREHVAHEATRGIGPVRLHGLHFALQARLLLIRNQQGIVIIIFGFKDLAAIRKEYVLDERDAGRTAFNVEEENGNVGITGQEGNVGIPTIERIVHGGLAMKAIIVMVDDRQLALLVGRRKDWH